MQSRRIWDLRINNRKKNNNDIDNESIKKKTTSISKSRRVLIVDSCWFYLFDPLYTHIVRTNDACFTNVSGRIGHRERIVIRMWFPGFDYTRNVRNFAYNDRLSRFWKSARHKTTDRPGNVRGSRRQERGRRTNGNEHESSGRREERVAKTLVTSGRRENGFTVVRLLRGGEGALRARRVCRITVIRDRVRVSFRRVFFTIDSSTVTSPVRRRRWSRHEKLLGVILRDSIRCLRAVIGLYAINTFAGAAVPWHTFAECTYTSTCGSLLEKVAQLLVAEKRHVDGRSWRIQTD